METIIQDFEQWTHKPSEEDGRQILACVHAPKGKFFTLPLEPGEYVRDGYLIVVDDNGAKITPVDTEPSFEIPAVPHTYSSHHFSR